MKTLYLDCFAGIAGDMFLGALLDAGADLAYVREGLSSLKIDGYKLETGKSKSHGISATFVRIRNTTKQPHRTFSDILEILDSASLPGDVYRLAKKVFERIARAEAKVHGTTPDKIHFHEVGAVDSICDIVGSLLALYSLNVERVLCSPLPAGSGFTKCAHGLIPVPAPATLELLKDVPVKKTEVEGELVTPTGAALATTLAKGFTSFPDMVVEEIGYGLGEKDYGFPNVLRAVIGKINAAKENDALAPGAPGDIIIIEASIDDLNPEFYPYITERLLKAGALDVFLTPVIMKWGRPGTLLTVLSGRENKSRLAGIIFSETSTLGIRTRQEQRQVALREIKTVKTRYGDINVKVARLAKGQAPVQVAPEYRDCRAAAEREGVPLKEVYNEALRVFEKSND